MRKLQLAGLLCLVLARGGSRKTRLQLFSSTKPCNADTRLETLTGPCWLPVRAR